MDDLAQYSLLFILKNSESLVIHNHTYYSLQAFSTLRGIAMLQWFIRTINCSFTSIHEHAYSHRLGDS